LRNLKLTVRSTRLVSNVKYFTKGYQPRTIIVKDEKSDSIADSHSIMARWRNYFSQILNVHWVGELGRQKYTQQNH
jgi:hypothetical protein